MSNMNPLSQYTKIPIKFTKLISNRKVPYKDGVINPDIEEFGICARSARDEMAFNNPDALLNGQAVRNVIENCVKDIKNADELYLPDVELLLIGIKLATKESSYEIETACPECGKVGAFERDLNGLFEGASFITEEPKLILEDSGLVLYMKPHTWKQHTHFSTKSFQQQKSAQLADLATTDEEKLKIINKIFGDMAELQFEMLLGLISKIDCPNDVVVTDPEFIRDWLSDLDRNTVSMIMEKSRELNTCGIEKTMEVGCSECHHTWTLEDLKFDPSSFFVHGFSQPIMRK